MHQKEACQEELMAARCDKLGTSLLVENLKAKILSLILISYFKDEIIFSSAFQPFLYEQNYVNTNNIPPKNSFYHVAYFFNSSKISSKNIEINVSDFELKGFIRGSRPR